MHDATPAELYELELLARGLGLAMPGLGYLAFRREFADALAGYYGYAPVFVSAFLGLLDRGEIPTPETIAPPEADELPCVDQPVWEATAAALLAAAPASTFAAFRAAFAHHLEQVCHYPADLVEEALEQLDAGRLWLPAELVPFERPGTAP